MKYAIGTQFKDYDGFIFTIIDYKDRHYRIDGPTLKYTKLIEKTTLERMEFVEVIDGE